MSTRPHAWRYNGRVLVDTGSGPVELHDFPVDSLTDVSQPLWLIDRDPETVVEVPASLVEAVNEYWLLTKTHGFNSVAEIGAAFDRLRSLLPTPEPEEPDGSSCIVRDRNDVIWHFAPRMKRWQTWDNITKADNWRDLVRTYGPVMIYRKDQDGE